jgi:hypothetical protein
MKLLIYLFLLVTTTNCFGQIRQNSDYSIGIESNYVEFENGYGVYQIPYKDRVGNLDTLFAYTRETLDYLYAPLIDSAATRVESSFKNGYYVKVYSPGDSLYISVSKEGIEKILLNWVKLD